MPSLKERFAEFDRIKKSDPKLYAEMSAKAKKSSEVLNTILAEL